MNYSFKLLAALLDYPTTLTIQIVNELHELLQSCQLFDEKSKDDIIKFASLHKNNNLLEWQQEYSSIFDITPITSLYLFEHIYGDSRKRGIAMSSLLETYAGYGLEISNQELPDYLPVFLDFISYIEDQNEALSYLADINEILKSIYEALIKCGSNYTLLLQCLITLSEKGIAHPIPKTTEVETNCPITHLQ